MSHNEDGLNGLPARAKCCNGWPKARSMETASLMSLTPRTVALKYTVMDVFMGCRRGLTC
jgi:hypothetical protein